MTYTLGGKEHNLFNDLRLDLEKCTGLNSWHIKKSNGIWIRTRDL